MTKESRTEIREDPLQPHRGQSLFQFDCPEIPRLDSRWGEPFSQTQTNDPKLYCELFEDLNSYPSILGLTSPLTTFQGDHMSPCGEAEGPTSQARQTSDSREDGPDVNQSSDEWYDY